MPAIKFSFSGSMSSNIDTLRNCETMEEVNVSDKTSQEVIDMLQSGQYSISFEGALRNENWSNIDMDDYSEEE